MDQRRVRITIDGQGNYALEALEGFSGASCVEQTKELEVAIGGVAVDEGKTAAYYDDDGSNPVSINLD